MNNFIKNYKELNKNHKLEQPSSSERTRYNGMIYLTIAFAVVVTALVFTCIGFALCWIDVNQFYHLIWK